MTEHMGRRAFLNAVGIGGLAIAARTVSAPSPNAFGVTSGGGLLG